MASKKIAVTLPEPLYAAVENARKLEHRSRSDLIQEAIRVYFQIPKYTPSRRELAAIDEALAERENSPEDWVAWEDLRADIRAR